MSRVSDSVAYTTHTVKAWTHHQVQLSWPRSGLGVNSQTVKCNQGHSLVNDLKHLCLVSRLHPGQQIPTGILPFSPELRRLGKIIKHCHPLGYVETGNLQYFLTRFMPLDPCKCYSLGPWYKEIHCFQIYITNHREGKIKKVNPI